MTKTSLVLVSIVVLQAPFAFGQTCQQLLDGQFGGTGTFPTIQDPLDNTADITVIDAMKRVQGMVYLQTAPGTTTLLTSFENGKDQWFPFCSSQTMGPNQYEEDYSAATNLDCDSPPVKIDGISPCTGTCKIGEVDFQPLDSYKQCCDNPLQAGPCNTKDGIPGLDPGKSGSKCKKRWEWSSIETFAKACRATQADGSQYGIPYFLNGFTHDWQGPSQTQYYYHFEDVNFLCMPESCSADAVRVHLQERADACTAQFQTGCMYWVREINQGDDSFPASSQHRTTITASQDWSKPYFGYELEADCADVQAGNAAGSGSLSPPTGKFKINEFLRNFMDLDLESCD
jgi:hypothetical protein